MNKTDEIKALIPSFLLDSPIIDSLFTQYGVELESLDNNSIDLLLQIFPQTATWGINLWEQMLNITINETTNLTIRRNKVIAKLAVVNPMNYYNFCTIVSKFADRLEVIQNFNDYSLNIKLITTSLFNIALSDIAKTIEEIKPAHLGYTFNLETQKIIKVATSRSYAYNQLNMCGTFSCGDGIVISSYGRSFSPLINIRTDYNKNIKDYDLAGTILSSLNSEFQGGIATIGRVYISNENINLIRKYLYDSQLSKTDGEILGTIYSKTIKIIGSYNDTINNYNEAGVDEAGQFMTGSSEEFNTMIGKIYASYILEHLTENNFTKEYNLTGEIIVSEEEIL